MRQNTRLATACPGQYETMLIAFIGDGFALGWIETVETIE